MGCGCWLLCQVLEPTGTYTHGDGNSLDSRGGGGNVLLESFAGGCSELQRWGEWAGYEDLHRTADHG